MARRREKPLLHREAATVSFGAVSSQAAVSFDHGENRHPTIDLMSVRAEAVLPNNLRTRKTFASTLCDKELFTPRSKSRPGSEEVPRGD
jgi:hypothetical protein